MGWPFGSKWKSKQDVLDHVKRDAERAGYLVEMSGSWLYATRDGKPVYLICVLTQKSDGDWGYKSISVSSGSGHYSAPLSMVLKVHAIFKNDEYYMGWLEKYPKIKQVIGSEAGVAASLFEEAA